LLVAPHICRGYFFTSATGRQLVIAGLSLVCPWDNLLNPP